MAEPTIQDNVRQLLSDLPQPIKDFLTDDLNGVAQSIAKKYDLHIDQAGTLERDLMLVLLGAREPAALAINLKEEAHLDDTTLVAILNDVNEQIFLPLRKQLQSASADNAQPTVTPPRSIVHPPLPTSSPAVPRPVPAPARPMPEPPANLPGVIQPQPQRMASAMPPAPKPLAAALQSAGVVPMLEDHEEPHIELKKAAPPPVPAPRVIPTTMPNVSQMPQPMPKPQPAPAPSATPPAPKAYVVDPYREQPEEHER